MLTDRQSQVISMIGEYVTSHGFPPTRTEIAKHFGFNTNAAQDHLEALRKKGAIELHAGISRGIKIIPAQPQR